MFTFGPVSACWLCLTSLNAALFRLKTHRWCDLRNGRQLHNCLPIKPAGKQGIALIYVQLVVVCLYYTDFHWQKTHCWTKYKELFCNRWWWQTRLYGWRIQFVICTIIWSSDTPDISYVLKAVRWFFHLQPRDSMRSGEKLKYIPWFNSW